MYKVPFLVALYVVKSLLDKGIQFKNGFVSYLVLTKKLFGVVWRDRMPLKNKPAWNLLPIHHFH